MVFNPGKNFFQTLNLYEPLREFSFDDNTIENVIEKQDLGIVIDKKYMQKG